jgi:hypothetical protein
VPGTRSSGWYGELLTPLRVGTRVWIRPCEIRHVTLGPAEELVKPGRGVRTRTGLANEGRVGKPGTVEGSGEGVDQRRGNGRHDPDQEESRQEATHQRQHAANPDGLGNHFQ